MKGREMVPVVGDKDVELIDPEMNVFGTDAELLHGISVSDMGVPMSR